LTVARYYAAVLFSQVTLGKGCLTSF
jgi:hypothetical protein